MDRILNLGCGNNDYGTDRVDLFETPTTTLVYDVEKGIPFPDKTFTEVYERNLLEHLRNVGSHLSECLRVLKPSGTLNLITDNAACTRFYIFGTHMGRYEKLHTGDHHYSVFTMNHLRNHIEAVGFSIVDIRYVKTDTLGRFLDCSLFSLTMPRIKVIATRGAD